MKKLLLILLTTFVTSFSYAQDAFLGEIRIFAGNYAPMYWMPCEGQTLNVSQYAALFSILGCTYGGDCVRTFMLPDLRTKVPVGAGTSQSTNMSIQLGEMYGSSFIQLNQSNIPYGNLVPVQVPKTKDGDQTTTIYNPAPSNMVPVQNYQPSLGVKYIICVQGIYPSRN